MIQKRRKQLRLGDVYAIPLPNGKYAYGRLFKDGCIAIYKHIGENIEDIPKEEKYSFTVGVYKDVLQSGKWSVVDSRAFKDENEAWPPPMCVIDSMSGEYSIYYKGEFEPSNEFECDGLEQAAVWEAEHIIDRIIGEDKWHKSN
ncbi:Imm26 family immunity protein [Clostridium sp. C8-1-8]|uniref:Imm26 family immunity protein n=1 Tax=Clostridium sp. C8-1-8 TaxID=2698831 RepID=UPI001369F37E|nr:Imm26 family immunity protein [Clostridium sp. C8-1-8]